MRFPLGVSMSVIFACGPAVGTGETSDSASGGQSATGSGTTSAAEATSEAESGVTTLVSSSSGEPQAVCGDGVMEGDEACDDGNAEQADGCSTACEASGSIRWTELLPPGFAVGLSAREGRAVAGVQAIRKSA